MYFGEKEERERVYLMKFMGSVQKLPCLETKIFGKI
jgi:hypothetical protein